jgi:hypothetical protein
VGEDGLDGEGVLDGGDNAQPEAAPDMRGALERAAQSRLEVTIRRYAVRHVERMNIRALTSRAGKRQGELKG